MKCLACSGDHHALDCPKSPHPVMPIPAWTAPYGVNKDGAYRRKKTAKGSGLPAHLEARVIRKQG